MNINLPTDVNTNLLMLFRWLHFVGGITWIGLLYFFNLVNVPFMKELDPATKGKVLPGPDVARPMVVPVGLGADRADGFRLLAESSWPRTLTMAVDRSARRLARSF